MNGFATKSLLTVALLGAPAGLATAAVPWPSSCALRACMPLCPQGDDHIFVVVNDFGGQPIAGSMVVIDFSQCGSGPFICPQMPGDPHIVDLPSRTLRMLTDANGVVDFPARIGGTGPADCVRVSADGVLLRTYALASYDQDGDGQCVSGNDDALFAAKFGTLDPTADFDCRPGVTTDDQVLFLQHHLHRCDGAVATHRRTWGSLKLHYR